MISLSIIIPCYNESKSLPRLIEECYIANLGRSDIQFVFVNNGSNDDTQIVLDNLLVLDKYSFGKSVLVPCNKGYGFGILEGLKMADGKILSWTHADLQTNPNDVILAYEYYRKELEMNKCIVKGERKNRKLLDNIFTVGMSFLSSILLKQKLWDINAQPKIFNRIFLTQLKNAPFDFSLDLYLLFIANKLKYSVNTFPVNFSKREFGEPKGGGTLKGKLKLVKRTLNYVIELRNDIKNGNR